MRLTWVLVSFPLLLTHAAGNPKDKDEKKEEEQLKPCTTRSPNTGSFFDLNPLHITLPDPDSKASKDARNDSWHVRGYDYGANFTINFCGSVVEELHNVVDVDRQLWKNISAFYTRDGKTYSIGQQNDELIFRGRKLVLNYTDGSPCPDLDTRRTLPPHTVDEINTPDAKTINYDRKNSLDGSGREKGTRPVAAAQLQRRKSSIISLLCERDPLAPKAAVSFVGPSPDECTYFFELRSSAACPSVNVEKRQVGPSAVFGLIFAIAFLVYLVGGIVYQRAVMHQRGWRQLPNYGLWAGIVSFIRDMIVILFYSCTRCFRKQKGFNQIMPENGHSRGRDFPVDDENRIIDQLDEEWDD